MNLKNLFGGWIHRGTLAGASLTALLGAGSASAQLEPAPMPLCPAPTLSTCQGEGYLTSYCGQKYTSLCNELIGDAFQEQWSALTQEHSTLMPEAWGATVGVSRITPNTSLSSTYVENGSGTYVGTVLKNQVLNRKKFQSLSFSDSLQRDLLQQWDARGPVVRSCNEFVHKKFNDYSKFEDRMGVHGADYRAYFNSAYDPDTGIANKDLKGIAGNTLAPIFNGITTAPKNLYFTAVPTDYPEGTLAYVIDPALLQKVPAEGRQHYRPTWAWHQQMSTSLAKVNDARLDRLFEEQLAFSELIQQRKAVWADYTRQSQGLSGDALTQLRQQTAGQLRGLDQSIEAGLQAADASNCLTLAGSLSCDWSPHRFKKMIEDVMMARRNGDHALCLTTTGNNFSESSPVRNAASLGIGLAEADYTLTPAKLNEFMSTYRSAIALQPRLVVAATQEVRRSDSRSSSDSFGGSVFGASYQTAAGWEFNTVSSGSMCLSFDARAYAYLKAYARLFGTNREVVYANAEATAQTGQVGYDVTLRVLGSDVFRENNTYPTSFSVGPDPQTPRATLFKIKGYFTIAGIPVSVSAGAAGTLGLNTQFTAQLASGCRFELVAQLKPWARLDGFAEVAVDVGIASAGVRGSVTLVRVELPYDVSLAVFLQSSGTMLRPMFELDTNLQLKVSTLDGNVVVFVRAFGLTAEKELASFNGISTTTTLLDENHTVPLSSFF